MPTPTFETLANSISTLITLSLVTCTTSYAQLVCPDRTIAYWSLDETSGSEFKDLAGENHAKCQNVCPEATRGLIQGGQRFDGATTEVSVPENPSFNWSGDQSFSLGAWFLNSAESAQIESFLGRTDDVSVGMVVWLGLGERNKPRFFLRDTKSEESEDDNTVSLIAPRSVQSGQWHHVVGVRNADDNQVHLYVDGVSVVSDQGTIFDGDFVSLTATLNIGWIESETGLHFDGTLDELAIYNRALSAAEVFAHYNNGLLGVPSCQNPSAPFILTAAVTEATAGDEYAYDVNASGVPKPTFSLIQLPAGMTIDRQTGLITWVPLDSQKGSHTVVVEARNSEGNHTQSFTVEVTVKPGCFDGTTISYWPLDEVGGTGFGDFLGLNDGSCASCPLPASGLIAGGQRFDGVSSLITVPPHPSFDFSNSDSFSLEAWFNTINLSNLEIYLGRAENIENGMQVWIGHNSNGRTSFFVKDSNSNRVLLEASGSLPLVTRWHHVVGVRNADTNELLLYLDGELRDGPIDTTGLFDGLFTSDTANLEIGGLSSGFHYSGRLDEVAIYRRALSPREISDHYNNGLAGIPLCKTVTCSPTILAQPESQEVCENEPVSLSILAAGPEPLSYQWRKNGVDIPGANSSSYETPNAILSNSGNYDVVVGNECDSVTSDVAVLIVKPAEDCAPKFKRGDTDGDGILTLGDPITNLGFQFLGTGDPGCMDALDFNDDGTTDLTDPVANLTHQFLGGPPPAQPGVESCGADPTEDGGGVDLGCAHYPKDQC